MSMCESSGECSFFKNEMGQMPSLVKVMKRRYCESDKERCARYMIKQKMHQGYTFTDDSVLDKIEADLGTMYPNDQEKATRIIEMMVQ